jgi:branched-subunit amino acid aminotransferase/4-amino-4-deoxychorismate lyase
VAECTSANVFAVFGQEVATPPLSEGCLPGITREVLLEEIRLNGAKTVERPLTVEDLYQADSVFITSTTRGLLPVRELEGRQLKAENEICGQMNQGFLAYVSADIARRRSTSRSAPTGNAPVHA